MTRRYENEESGEDILRNLIITIAPIYIVILVFKWLTNKNNFWIWLLYGVIFLVILISCIIIWHKIKNKISQRKKDHIINIIKQAGLEEYINNFILRFGLGQEKSKDTFKIRNYSIDQNRINDLQDFLSQKQIKFSTSDIDILLSYYIEKREKEVTFESIKVTTRNFSELNGSDFEKLLYRLFEAMGYTVQLIGKTGDQGGDLIATRDQERTIIQAKCYNDTNAGNSAVQEIVAARNHYNCNKATVITTSHFTKEAIELAKTNNVDLIPREVLQKMLLDYLHESWN